MNEINYKDIENLMKSNNFTEAEKIIVNNLKNFPDEIRLYVKLCELYILKKDLDNLFLYSSSLIENFPDKFQGYKYQAVALREKELFVEADIAIMDGLKNLAENDEDRQWLLVESCKNAERLNDTQLLLARLKLLITQYPENNYANLDRLKHLRNMLVDSNPMVSVVVPVYNTEKYLDETLESILKQTLKDIEIICVDDGSTDKSLEILEKYAKDDERIKILKQENKGAGIARNLGMSIATGYYITFLDSDDIYELNMLEKLYCKAILENLDIVVCRVDLYDEKDKEIKDAQWTIHDNLMPEKRPFKSVDVEKNFFMTFVFWPWDKLYKKEYIDNLDIKFSDFRTTNDLFFVAAAILKADKINFIDDILVHHTKRYKEENDKESLSVSRELSWNNFYYALTEIKMFMREHKIYSHFEKDFVNYSLHLSLWNLHSLSGKAYYLLYKSLHDEFFEELSVKNHTEGYFYSKKDFFEMKEIVNTSLNHYLMNIIYNLENELGNNLDIIDYVINRKSELENNLLNLKDKEI